MQTRIKDSQALHRDYVGQVNRFTRPVLNNDTQRLERRLFLATVTEVSSSHLCTFSFYAMLYIMRYDHAKTYFEALEVEKC